VNRTGTPIILALLVFLAGATPGYPDDLLSRQTTSPRDKPIEITSDRMRSDGSGQKIVFSGKVEGKWGDLVILADVLEVYNPNGDRKTDRIVAIGHVIITRGLKKARGDRAVYLEKKQKITLTGNPKATAWEGKNVIEGKEMIFLLDADRFVVNERVRMKIYPKKESRK